MDLDEEEDGLGGDDLTGRAMEAVLASAYKAANLADRVVKFDINGTERQFVHHVKSDGRRPKWIFFKLQPSLSPEMYGWSHYETFYNSHTKRGWLGNCQLKKVYEIIN